MKKTLIILIIWVFTISANWVFALTYSDGLSIDSNYGEVSTRHISEAKLLQNYIRTYKENINNVYKLHTRGTTPMIRDTNLILEDMIVALDAIQKKQVNPDSVEWVMLRIVSDIKDLNVRVKTYLKERQRIYEEKIEERKAKYTTISKRISSILDNLISSMTQSLSKKKSLSSQEKIIVKSLVRIRDENNKIKAFESIRFDSEAEMQIYFQGIVNNLRKEILIIKEASS